MNVRTALVCFSLGASSFSCSSTDEQERENARDDGTEVSAEFDEGAGPGSEPDSGVMEERSEPALGVVIEPSCETPPCSSDTEVSCDPAPGDQVLCVFDYDLTISANKCDGVDEDSFCRQNVCGTYGWLDQCIAPAARTAIATCIENGAYIGIASHAHVDECWNDKVLPIVEQKQFSEWTGSPRYASGAGGQYPALDERSNWNCLDCAYHMDPSIDKAEGIRRVMNHYGMSYDSPTDRAHVIFWDDSPTNIRIVEEQLPEVRAVLVPRLNVTGENGGCGITEENIAAGWAGLEPACASE